MEEPLVSEEKEWTRNAWARDKGEMGERNLEEERGVNVDWDIKTKKLNYTNEEYKQNESFQVFEWKHLSSTFMDSNPLRLSTQFKCALLLSQAQFHITAMENRS